MSNISITPIGTLNCNFDYKFEQPRQAKFANNSGVITLNSGQNFEQALHDLNGFDYIWVIYLFHKNSGWKPKVSPPICTDNKKKGVFSTRSPHRPNPIGMSCVKLISVNGLKLEIEDFDLLNNTPILDIKPYVATYDSFPNATKGWIPDSDKNIYTLHFSDTFNKKAEWVLANGGFDLTSFSKVQLTTSPLSTQKKRVLLNGDGTATISFRTWRVSYLVSQKNKKRDVFIDDVFSGYSTLDLKTEFDKYGDKGVHILFGQIWS